MYGGVCLCFVVYAIICGMLYAVGCRVGMLYVRALYLENGLWHDVGCLAHDVWSMMYDV